MAAAAEERISALMSGEGASSLAAAVALFGTHDQGKNETLSKTRVWGFGEKMLPCFRATTELSAEPRWGYEKSSWKTVSGSALDANGNTLTDPSGKQYTWDFENRLMQAVVPGTGTTTFRYDPFGRRIQKSGPLGTTNYLYDGRGARANIIEEVDPNGSVLARYSQGTLVDEPLAELRGSTISYYEADDQGSVTSLSNSAGTLANTYTYDSFGRLTASTGTFTNPFQYTGREFDPETDSFFYRARYYDPNAGRFTGEDPIQFSGGVNFYAYVRNSPLNYLDPTGMSRTPWKNVSTRPCNIDEYVKCEDMCGSRGVESCEVQIVYKLVRWKGKSEWRWVDSNMSCSCNEPKSLCRKTAEVLSWATLLALAEEYGWVLAF